MKECEVNDKQVFVTNKDAAELAEPGVGAFDLPAPFVASQFPSVFVFPPMIVIAVRHYQIDAALSPSFPQRVRVVAAIGDHAFGLLPRATFAPRDTDFFECGVRKRNFRRRGTFKPNSQRNTFTVSQYHPLCAFTTLGFADSIAPFLAGAKLPSMKASSHRNRPLASNSPSNVRQALSHTPCSSHPFNRRQQVDGEGYSSGRKRQAAPVCSIQRIPSKKLRFGAGGRPRPSFRRFGSGNSGPINSHCSSVNTFCRFFTREAQQLNRLKCKYLA